MTQDWRLRHKNELVSRGIRDGKKFNGIAFELSNELFSFDYMDWRAPHMSPWAVLTDCGSTLIS